MKGLFVLKIAAPDEGRESLEFENAIIRRLSESLERSPCPALLVGLDGAEIVSADERFLRVVSYLPGEHLAAQRPLSCPLLENFGRALGEVDRVLLDFEHPGMGRHLRWDLALATWINPSTDMVVDVAVRKLVRRFLIQFQAVVESRFSELRRSVIHNDANDYNVLVTRGEISGLIDFGDSVHTCTVFELAIAGAYAVLDAVDPVADLCTLVKAYHQVLPLEEVELEVLFAALCMRYCVSIVAAELDRAKNPDNEYISVSQEPVRRALAAFAEIDPAEVTDRLRAACEYPVRTARRSKAEIAAARTRSLGAALSVSYAEPLQIVRGSMQYLFDDRGRSYVDCVNNVCHVGHCHPRVVAAAQEQMATLNTNTRYLHENIVEYAERLTGLFPEPLDTCFFVCSGSEANELALRLARAYTDRHDVVVVDHAYHGNTSSLVDLSPYKHDGPGGRGRPDHVHVAALPDGLRGDYLYGTPDLGKRYAESVTEACARAERNGGAAAFLVESISGCGGQVEFPDGYLAAAFARARKAGALCIGDEVQVGFGRVGTHMWAFESQGVVPDIVTLGKPIGNGHPLAAVVTRSEIAAAFDNGMEYFNTFGGNPVSCAIGLAVLDVIEADGLMANAKRVGDYLIEGFRYLEQQVPMVVDVRGRGLFLGVEFVRDRKTLEPAAAELSELIEAMKRRGFLLSIDGPQHNVLKFKPPMPFSIVNASGLLQGLEAELGV